MVADIVAELIDTPIGGKPFRVVADRTGVGEHVDGYNEHLARVTHGVYRAFGNDDMLRLNAQGA